MKIDAALADMPLVVEEMFWLAYQASHVVGMGIMQSRNDATKAEIVLAVVTLSSNVFYADYVFGRMMKLTVHLTEGGTRLEVPDTVPTFDYQSWCFRYPTYADLFYAAFATYKGKTP